MSTEKVLRPRCLHCGEPLKSAPYFLRQLRRERGYRLADFGAEGDNLFCNERCGYRWAVTQLTGDGWKQKRVDFIQLPPAVTQPILVRQGDVWGWRRKLEPKPT